MENFPLIIQLCLHFLAAFNRNIWFGTKEGKRAVVCFNIKAQEVPSYHFCMNGL